MRQLMPLVSGLDYAKIIEYAAVFFVITGVFMISMPKIEGQIFMVIAQVLWTMFAIKKRHWGLLLQSLILFFIAIYAVYSWSLQGVG